MRILFLDQSNKLGGAELCLADIAQQFRDTSLVGVFTEGAFPDYLRQLNIPVAILAQRALQVQKDSGLRVGLKSVTQLIPLITTTARLSRNYDLIYANTQKALVVGALASRLSGRPLVYHLHDIVSPDHFSATNRRIIITLANQAALVIANSQASRDAFVAAGGRADRVHIVYNGFRPDRYQTASTRHQALRRELNVDDKFVIGHFSRLAPWKGQHILLKALADCPDSVVVLLVGDALFGEADYVTHLHQLVNDLKLANRVHFLGFRSDVPDLMGACDLIAHTSTAPEPFGRVIVEAMLSGRPVVASAAGGAMELVQHGHNGWLFPPSEIPKLTEIITECQRDPSHIRRLATRAQLDAQHRFNLHQTNQNITHLLTTVMKT